jgi:hypothetical protein
LEEVENDISYVYSGFAPISVRLVQCIAQKGGVLSNPAEKEKPGSETSTATVRASSKVRAHPIVGWKGFEDVADAIPGETIDIVPNLSEQASSGLSAANSELLHASLYLNSCNKKQLTLSNVPLPRWCSSLAVAPTPRLQRCAG